MHLEPSERELNEARLTAYALGELEGDERAEIERLLEGDAAARAEVESTRRVAAAVQRDLNAHDDGAATLTSEQRQGLEERMGGPVTRPVARIHRRVWYGVGVTALAAVLGLTFVAPYLFDMVSRDRRDYARGIDVAEESEGLALSSPEPAMDELRENLRYERLRESISGREMRAPAGERADATAFSPPPPRANETSGPGRQGRPRQDAGPSGGMVGGGGDFSSEAPADDDRAIRDTIAEHNTESYDHISDNPFIDPSGGEEEAHSTFSIDVDTASYANIRRFISGGQLPPKDAVRIEEMVNYFTYDYPAPEEDSEHPFAADVEIAPAPWNPDHRLVRIGLKGREIDMANRVGTNIVFLLDVSGSMNAPDKLPLLKQSMKMLIDTLGEDDRVAIVVYASASGVVLDSTYCNRKQDIIDAIDRLRAGGSTNGGEGIQLAYRLAQDNFIDGGVNRVIWATDGDLNVGVTDDGALVRMIEDKRKSGIELSVLGFGTGNLKDSKLEKISNAGNGNYAYIDSADEAKKVLVEQIGGTLFTIAADVKIQVEFNPRHVEKYRLIGYENRMLRKQDFRDDAKDAGEIGAGHTVTALYEIVPKRMVAMPGGGGGAGGGGAGDGGSGARPPAGRSEGDRESGGAPAESDLTFQEPTRPRDDPAVRDYVLELALRYKPPGQPDASGTEFSMMVRGERKPLESASDDFKFAAAVAAYGMILRDSPHKGDASLALVEDLATPAVEHDGGYRDQFLELVRRTRALIEQNEQE